MADIGLSFSAEGGISLDDLVGIFTGTIDPGVSGEDAPLGSIFVRQSGQLYQKVGPLNTDWIRFTQGLGEGVKISALDPTSGYLNTKLLTAPAFTKLVSDPSSSQTLTLDLADVGTAGTFTSVTTNSKGQIVSGANPGFLTSNQNITVSGDVTGSGSTSIALTLQNTGVVAGSYTNSNVSVDSKGRVTAISNGYVAPGAGYLLYRADTSSFAAGDPGPGFIRWNNPVHTNSTEIYVDIEDDQPGGIEVSLYLSTIVPNTILWLQDRNDASIYQRWLVTAVQNMTGWFEYSVSLLDGNLISIANNQPLALTFKFVGSEASVTSIAATAPAAGFQITGSPITSSGTLAFTLTDDLAAIENISSNGFAVRTNADTWTTRSIVGAANRISIVGSAGTTSDPVIDIAINYVGQTSITTLGLISAGTWQGTVVGTQYGGTGRSTIGAANQILGVTTTGSGLEYKTVQAGAGIIISPTTQQLTISNSGVISAVGTVNQVSVVVSAGAATISLPQNIHTAATPTFAQLTVAADPTLPLQVATKQYVDNAIQGLNPKQSVRAATISNITLTGPQTIDGVSVVAGNRVLVKDQTTQSQNGLYVVAAGAWARSADMDLWTEVPGAFVIVEEGTTLADTAWVSTANQGGTLDTTSVTFVQFGSATSITAGAGLTKTGNSLAITTIGAGGTFNNVTVNTLGQVTSGSTVAYLTGNQTIVLSGDVTGSGANAITTTLSNTGVGAGTYRSVTVDTKGRVTAGTNPTTLSGYAITDAQPLNAFLTSEAALATDGIVVRNGNLALTRSIAVASSKLSIVDGNGVLGNPTLDIQESNISINNLSGVLSTTKGGTGLASLGAANQLLGVNSGSTASEYKTLTGTGITVTHSVAGINISTVNNGTVTSVGVIGSTGLTVSGSPVTTSGNITLTLGSELQGLSGLSALGIVTRTGASTYASRNIVSGAGTISITNPAGTAGNIGVELTTVGTAGTYRSVTTDVYGRVTAGTNPTTLSGYGITDAINVSQLGAVNGVATLNASGKLNASQIPASAISDTFVVASQIAQTALVAEIGDVAVRTDLSKSFILRTEPASVFANWQELLTPTSSVVSVNGQTGVVTVGTVTSVGITTTAGLSVTNSPITSAGNIALSLANDLAAVEGLSTVGLVVRTGTDTWATRTLVAGSGITLGNANGVTGDITISAGSVTSVGLSAPSIFSVSNSPVTSTGTLTLALTTQPANTVFAGSALAGQTIVPVFRTLGLAQGDLNDVTITSATISQVLAYNGTRWVNTGAVGANAAGLVGVGQSGAAAWTLISGTSYRADFAHNLATTNVVITVFDSSTNAVVVPASTTLTNANTVRIQVVGNTRTLRVVVVANGQSIVAGGSTPSSVIVAKDGVTVGTTTTKLNFTGQAVNVSDAGSGTTNISIGARYSYFANSLDTPNNADFVINALAPVTTDPSFNSLNVRSFSNAVEQGVGFLCSIPAGSTQVTFKFRGRSQTAQAVATVVQPRIYHRAIPNNAAVGTWSAANELANINIPNNTNFQYAQQTVLLSTLGLTSDRLFQFELTRRVAGVTGSNLPAQFLLAEVTLEFS